MFRVIQAQFSSDKMAVFLNGLTPSASHEVQSDTIVVGQSGEVAHMPKGPLTQQRRRRLRRNRLATTAPDIKASFF